MRVAFICFSLLLVLYGFRDKVFVNPSHDDTKYVFTDMGPSSKGDTTIIYGQITEVNCFRNLDQTRVTYGTRMYAWFSTTRNFPTVCADSLGNFLIEVDTLSSYKNIGMSFNYTDSYAHANYFLLIPLKYSGRILHLEAKLDTSPIWGGHDCF